MKLTKSSKKLLNDKTRISVIRGVTQAVKGVRLRTVWLSAFVGSNPSPRIRDLNEKNNDESAIEKNN